MVSCPYLQTTDHLGCARNQRRVLGSSVKFHSWGYCDRINNHQTAADFVGKKQRKYLRDDGC